MPQITIQQAFERALQHHQAGRLHQAEQLYRQILAQQPNHPDALHYLGVIAHQGGQNDIAVDLIHRAIALNPNDAAAHANLGNVLRDSRRADEAIAAYKRAIACNPHLPEAHYNLGNALHATQQLNAAIVAYRQAVALRPDYAEAHNNLGNVLADNGQFDEAIAACRQALTLKPDYAEAYSNLGSALKDAGQLDEAIAAYRQAIVINPNFAGLYNNYGNALTEKRRLDEAIAALRRAIALDPNFAPAHNNLGTALSCGGQLDAAIRSLRHALALRPNYALAHSNLVYTLHFHPDYDAAAIAEELGRWDLQHAAPLQKLIRAHGNDPDPHRRLRVGYVSPDLRYHVMGRHLLPLFLQHDRRFFEVSCYSNVPCPDALTRQFRRNADGWRNIVGLSDEQAAEQIRADQIDILVDLTLHTCGNRLLLFARKPAPVQVTYLAYGGSSGMKAIDYRISDPYLDPRETDLSCYSEKTLRLPRTFWCYEPGGPTDEPSPSPFATAGVVTFGCLNNFAKVSSASLDLWARILLAVPNSRLLLHACPGTHLEHVVQTMKRGGVAAERLQFVGQQPWAAYIQTYSRIDIILDPFPWAGGITTCDALWMGVPVVTLSGQTAVGRGGRSILSNLGLPELIAFNQDEYVRIAVELAKDPDRFVALRRGMRARMLASPLMDAEALARDLEVLYRQMWQHWCAATAPS